MALLEKTENDLGDIRTLNVTHSRTLRRYIPSCMRSIGTVTLYWWTRTLTLNEGPEWIECSIPRTMNCFRSMLSWILDYGDAFATRRTHRARDEICAHAPSRLAQLVRVVLCRAIGADKKRRWDMREEAMGPSVAWTRGRAHPSAASSWLESWCALHSRQYSTRRGVCARGSVCMLTGAAFFVFNVSVASWPRSP